MISSTSNAQVKNIEKLMKSSRERTEQGLYVCEGIKMFLEVMERPGALVKAYFAESFLSDPVYRERIEERLTVPYEVLSDSVFAKASETKTPQGVLGLVRCPEYTLKDILSGKENRNPAVLMLENLRDPGNLGTIVRTAEGAGIDGIILSRESVDIFSPKVIRATMGAIYRVPFVYVENFTQTVKEVSKRGIRTCAAHLAGSVCYDEPDYISPCALLIGNEANGLTDETAEAADIRIRIPMEGAVESLNAAVAAAVLMYEVHRQRH